MLVSLLHLHAFMLLLLLLLILLLLLLHSLTLTPTHFSPLHLYLPLLPHTLSRTSPTLTSTRTCGCSRSHRHHTFHLQLLPLPAAPTTAHALLLSPLLSYTSPLRLRLRHPLRLLLHPPHHSCDYPPPPPSPQPVPSITSTVQLTQKVRIVPPSSLLTLPCKRNFCIGVEKVCGLDLI